MKVRSRWGFPQPSEPSMSAELQSLASILECAPVGGLVVDAAGRVLCINTAAERILGHSRQALLGNAVEILLPEGFRQKVAEAMSTASRTRQRPRQIVCELRGKHQSGAAVPLEVSLTQLDSNNGPVALAYLRDLSERRQLEERARQSQKMEAVGRLAGGVAHDFNNLLTAIIGYSEMLQRKLTPGAPMWEELQQIRRAGERAAGLTKQLLAFSRKQVLAPVVLDLNAHINGMQDLLRRLIREDINLSISLDPALRSVKADPAQIEQVLINLVVNARDAMPRGGRLVISTLNAAPSQIPSGTQPEILLTSYALLSVSDTGCGMDETTKARIFEPFFTTKAVGHGTGLGLATVYGIVKQSGGQIEVHSEVGKGSVFQVYLPQTGSVPDTEAPAVPAELPPKRGAETILLAEDEEGVRLLAGRVLEANGYRVLHARDGQEALQICRQHPWTIHLLLTDVVMPNLNGRDLVHKALAMRPQMKIVYMSGYTDSIIALHKILESGAAFLQKPFPPELLIRTIREVLDQEAALGAVQ
jgi:PAS domain S-box-containing protein